MTSRTRIAALAVALLVAGTTAAFGSGAINVPPGSINGVKHAVGKDGRLKARAVGTRQLKPGVVTCTKLSYDLARALCTGKPGTAKNIVAAPGKPGDGFPGATGSPGQTGSQGPTGANGGRGDGVTLVEASTPGITYSNPSVNLTAGGVQFGPYTNNSAGDLTSGGTVRVNLGTGITLADVAHLAYTARFSATADNGDAPYLRVFIDNDSDGTVDHDVVFSPSTQPGACYGPGGGPASDQCASRGRMIEYHVDEGTVRYDDDPGSTPDVSWSSVVNAHGSDLVMNVLVSVGNSQPGTTGGTLNSLSYEIAGVPPATLAFAH